jgi:predicted nucleic acid-binding protein
VSSRIVLDASVVIGWTLGEPETLERANSVIEALKTATALVPVIWQAEVARRVRRVKRSSPPPAAAVSGTSRCRRWS